MRKIFFIAVFCLVGVGLYMAVHFANDGPVDTNKVSVAGMSTNQNEIMQDKFFYANNFYHTLEVDSALENTWPQEKIRAGIIPHDITQGQMMANFFKNIARQSPQRLILLGPNHYEKGETSLVTTMADWQTEFGQVMTDDQTIAGLLDYASFSLDSNIIENEHAVSAVAPYISYYLPNAQVVPIIFKANTQQYQMDSLINILSGLVDENTVVIAAVDFSHYLNKQRADFNDGSTMKFLEELDYQSILNLGNNFNDYLDSPVVIGLLLKWLAKMDYNNYKLIDHTNSADQDNRTDIPTTSYFEIIYY